MQGLSQKSKNLITKDTMTNHIFVFFATFVVKKILLRQSYFFAKRQSFQTPALRLRRGARNLIFFFLSY